MWSYQEQKLDSLIPGYVAEAKHKYQHRTAQQQQHSVHRNLLATTSYMGSKG